MKTGTSVAVGQRFGRWVVTGEAEKIGVRKLIPVRCDCGTTKSVDRSNLVGGLTKSCGCLAVESIVARTLTHGMTESPEYQSWCHAKARCGNPNHKDYADYGGRGIRVCDEWMESFEAFYNHVGRKPGRLHSLDRIDPNGHYAPGNVRWATPSEQRLNRRDVLFVTAFGENKTMYGWARDARCVVQYQTLKHRIRSYGWEPESAITRPARKRFPTASPRP